MSPWLRTAVLLAAAAAAAPAQAPGAPEARPPATGVQQYSESVSRDLFAACDADSDDRLDVFEAGDALDLVRDARDTNGFRRFDVDRDGFVSWVEFDQQFWDTVQRGGSFRVRTCRSLIEASPERQAAQAPTPVQSFLQMHDQNRNGGLDQQEIEAMVRATGLPPTIGVQLRAQDHDRSGRIDEAELAPWFEQLRGLLPGSLFAAANPNGVLPPPWQHGDTDADGRIGADELAAMLRRLDPMLARWATTLLRALDRDGDGTLGAGELPQPQPPVRHGTARQHRPDEAPDGPPRATAERAAVPARR